MNYSKKPGRSMLLTFVMLAVALWCVEAFFDFTWFEAEPNSLFHSFFPADDPHEMFVRTLMVSAVIFCGAIVSFLYGRAVHSEKEALESEENLKTLFNSIGDAVIATDRQ